MSQRHPSSDPPLGGPSSSNNSFPSWLSAEETHSMISRYRAILAAVPDIIMEVDSNKVYTWCNKAGREFFGDDVVGHEAAEYFVGPQDTYKAVAPLFEGSEDTIYVESWQKRRDGEKRLLAWWCRTLKDDDGKMIGSLSTARDVTERRNANEAIFKSEQRLQAVLSSMPILLDAFDENHRIIEWNRECERVTGYSAEEIVGRDGVWELLYPDADYRRTMLEEWKRRGNSFLNWEWDITCKDGGVRTIAWSHLCEEYPVPGWASWGVGFDVTERKRTVKQLRESESFLETIFKNAPYPSLISDETGTLIRVNQAFCDLTGVTEEQIVGKYNVFQDNYLKGKGYLDRIREVFTEGKTIRFELEYDMKALKEIDHSSSNRGVLDVIVSPILDEAGNVRNVIVQNQDITERKKTEEKIRELNQSLERRVRERTEELRRAVHLMAGREIRMAEMKDAIRLLRKQLIEAGIEPKANDPLLNEHEASFNDS
ncbi:MAG: PAS domain-containing protein [Phycisphaerae bacterium]|nr:PAS domain-containing protein [Phycisphaerae bacterium]